LNNYEGGYAWAILIKGDPSDMRKTVAVVTLAAGLTVTALSAPAQTTHNHQIDIDKDHTRLSQEDIAAVRKIGATIGSEVYTQTGVILLALIEDSHDDITSVFGALPQPLSPLQERALGRIQHEVVYERQQDINDQLDIWDTNMKQLYPYMRKSPPLRMAVINVAFPGTDIDSKDDFYAALAKLRPTLQNDPDNFATPLRTMALNMHNALWAEMDKLQP
jgi:hypothetical protein